MLPSLPQEKFSDEESDPGTSRTKYKVTSVPVRHTQHAHIRTHTLYIHVRCSCGTGHSLSSFRVCVCSLSYKVMEKCDPPIEQINLYGI